MNMIVRVHHIWDEENTYLVPYLTVVCGVGICHDMPECITNKSDIMVLGIDGLALNGLGRG